MCACEYKGQIVDGSDSVTVPFLALTGAACEPVSPQVTSACFLALG